MDSSFSLKESIYHVKTVFYRIKKEREKITNRLDVFSGVIIKIK